MRFVLYSTKILAISTTAHKFTFDFRRKWPMNFLLTNTQTSCVPTTSQYHSGALQFSAPNNSLSTKFVNISSGIEWNCNVFLQPLVCAKLLHLHWRKPIRIVTHINCSHEHLNPAIFIGGDTSISTEVPWVKVRLVYKIVQKEKKKLFEKNKRINRVHKKCQDQV